MMISCSIIFSSVLLINWTVDAESQQVVGVIGGSVVLPCVLSKNEHNLSGINVHWRHNGLKVHDIVNGTVKAEHQDPKYRNRTEDFSDEFMKGNFSIKLKNLNHTDAGEYHCNITPLSKSRLILLIINESTEAKEKPSTPEDGNTPGNTILCISICVLSAVFMLCICLCIKCRKNNWCNIPSSLRAESCRVIFKRISNTSEPENQHQLDFP